MIKLIEAKNFRSLRYVRQSLDSFHVLIGPNASGKTTFLDVVSFLADIVRNGIDYAINERSSYFQELTFGGRGGDIELALEASIPPEVRHKIWDKNVDTIRYEIKFGVDDVNNEHLIIDERVVIFNGHQNHIPFVSHTLFPQLYEIPPSILNRKYASKTYRQILRKNPGGNDNYNIETGKGWIPSFKLGSKRSALGNLPADESKFPATFWMRNLLTEGVQLFILDSLNIRKASPPGQSRKFKPDGSNLPWVIDDLQKEPARFTNWIEHLRTALPDIKTITTIERPDDRHRYLKIDYVNGISVPSWLVSDGTLRLLALTIPAYLPDFSGIYLIEEPENGIHPKAIETIFQSLSSAYTAQILLASHSPVILSIVDPRSVLCFAKTSGGVTDIVRGNEHPLLKSWKGEVNLGLLYAGGILG